MEYRNISDIKLMDRPGKEIRYRNFSGTEGKYNPPGRRSITLTIDPELAPFLKTDGWNIKEKLRGDDVEYQLQVFINYDNPRKIPKINIIRMPEKKRVPITEDTIGELDSAEIESFDIKINPYQWELNGNTGVKAFVKSMNVCLEVDEVADRYLETEEPEELPFI